VDFNVCVLSCNYGDSVENEDGDTNHRDVAVMGTRRRRVCIWQGPGGMDLEVTRWSGIRWSSLLHSPQVKTQTTATTKPR